MPLRVQSVKKYLYRVHTVLQALVLVASSLLLIFGSQQAYAAGQLTERSLQIGSSSSAASNATTPYVFSFKLATTGAGAANAVNGLKFLVCTTAIGTCTAPTGFSWTSSTYGGFSGFSATTPVFAKDATGANDCTASANVLCLKRSTNTTTGESTSTARTITMNNVQNPTTLSTFFVRITTYNLITYTVGSIVDEGTVASATSQTLTISAIIQEILSFCIGATSVNDATTSAGGDCSSVTGTSVNLGTLDSGSVSVTPVSTEGGSNTNGLAMLRTNAVNGATVSYKAVQQSGTNHLGTMRVSGASCNSGNVNTDQCIDAQGSTQGAFSAGTEKFGMTVAGTNCGSTSAYSCSLTGGTNNLKASSNYIGATATTFGTSAGFAWVEGGTATQIASSSTVVDDEALILKFAATPSITSPTGSYTAQADFIAIATF